MYRPTSLMFEDQESGSTKRCRSFALFGFHVRTQGHTRYTQGAFYKDGHKRCPGYADPFKGESHRVSEEEQNIRRVLVRQ